MKNELLVLFSKFEDEVRYTKCLRPKTIKGYKDVFILFTKIMPDIITVDQLTSSIMTEFFKRIQTRVRKVGNGYKKGVENSTIKTQRSKLHVFLEWLKKNGHFGINPLKYVESPYVKYDDFKKIEQEDIDKIYSSIVQHSFNSFIRSRDTMMVSILLYTGVRRGELISLRVRDIDFDKKEITIRKETSKSKLTRTLPLHSTALQHIKEHLKEKTKRNFKTECLITSSREDRGLSDQGLKHWVESIKEKSGVDFHLHMFRHTFAVNLDKKNISGFKIQKLLGHVDIQMTQKYVRSMKTEAMREDIDKLSF